jgi:hypothetical protein
MVSFLVRFGVRCGLTLAACLSWAGVAAAEVTLVEKDGWTFSADGRINGFASIGWGDDFPEPTPNPAGVDQPQHTVLGGAGQQTRQANSDNRYFAARFRNGFVGNVLGFSLKRNVTDTTTVKGYIGLWSVIESYRRARRATADIEVREGFMNFDGPWGSLIAGRTLGFFGRISTEINFLYGHNYGLGYPCGDERGPTCGHIGTGVMFPGFSPGFLYSTPSLAGLKLHAGLYDPVRLLGAWNRATLPRPEGGLTFEQKLSDTMMFKLGVEGVFQQVSKVEVTDADGAGPEPLVRKLEKTSVWGAAAGGRFEAGPFRIGLAAFRGKGLGFYYALQNSPAVFDTTTQELRSFTGLYGQTALALGDFHVAVGAGRVTADQLQIDVENPLISTVKAQTGLSAGVFYRISDSLVLGLDYFRFMTNWWGAANSIYGTDAMGNPAVVRQPGVMTPEKQTVSYVNVGATFQW